VVLRCLKHLKSGTGGSLVQRHYENWNWRFSDSKTCGNLEWGRGGGFWNSETFGNLEFGGRGAGRVSESDLIYTKDGTGGYYTKVKYPADPILVRVDPRREQNGNSEVL
jgi:hypothetical protein